MMDELIAPLPLGDVAADRLAFASLLSERNCLARRATHATGGTFEQQAWYCYHNSHRFRRRGLDGTYWMFYG